MRLLIQFIITLSSSSGWAAFNTVSFSQLSQLSLLSLLARLLLFGRIRIAANQLKRHLRKCCQGKLKLKRQHECLNERINEDETVTETETETKPESVVAGMPRMPRMRMNA